MSLKNFLKGRSVHFIGIGGISMSALAKYLFAQGYTVSGSDVAVNEEVVGLENMGISVSIGHDSKRVLQAQTVVYTDAVSQDNVELVQAQKEGALCLSRMQLLNAVAQEFASVIAVAGSHGKTSATAMCGHVLLKSGLPFTAHIGGRDPVLDNFYSMGKKIFLTEACEYKKNLLALSNVNVAVWLNCDKDHLECYRDFEDLKQTFYRYASAAQYSVVNVDDKNILPPPNAVTFGIQQKNCDYRAVSLKESGERYAFTVMERGEKICRIRLRAVGGFHVYNALATVATMRCMGIEPETIVKGLESFTGVKRRFEKIGSWGGVEFFCDYAHHPVEIEKAINLANRRKKGKVFVIFQPHTYSRTKFLMEEFIKVLSAAENSVIYKTYAAREEYDETASAYSLHQRIKNSLYAESTKELEIFIKKSIKGGDTVLFLGAGDIYYLAGHLLLNLGGRLKKDFKK